LHPLGHGVRLDPCYELSNKSTGDLALALLDWDSSRARLLPGPRLAGLLKSDKALVITLVLDCCFSARGQGQFAIRSGSVMTWGVSFHGRLWLTELVKQLDWPLPMRLIAAYSARSGIGHPISNIVV